MWQAVAGINTDQRILNAFVRDELLFWTAAQDGRKRMNIASWGTTPVCENINPGGVGTYGNSACTLLPATPAVQPRSRLLPLSFAENDVPPITVSDRESDADADVVTFLGMAGRYYRDYGQEFDAALLQFDWTPGSSMINRLSRQSPVSQHTPRTLSANNGAVLVSLENDQNWRDTAFVYYNDFSEVTPSTEVVNVDNVQALYLPYYEPATLTLDSDQAAMVAFYETPSGDTYPGLFVYDRSDGESQFNLAYTLRRGGFTVNQLDASRGRVALARRGKVQLMTMMSDGQVQYNQSIAPAELDAGYFEAALNNNTLLVGASTVYQWEESGLNRRFADIWEQTEPGRWQFLQRLQYQDRNHSSFAKQVYLSNDSAVVMSLRLDNSDDPNAFDNQVYEPHELRRLRFLFRHTLAREIVWQVLVSSGSHRSRLALSGT
jgi:hypothetical protein